MIVVDTSALVAMTFGEPERAAFLSVITSSRKALVSAVTAVEARMVAHGRRGEGAVALLNDLLALPVFEVVSPDDGETAAAYAAFVVYGKGNGHPASLNFGDLFSYSLAKTRNLPLLFKGDDFTHTDIVPALPSPAGPSVPPPRRRRR